MQKKTIYIFVAVNLLACLPGFLLSLFCTYVAWEGKGQVRLNMSQSKQCEYKKHNPRAKYNQ